MRIAFGNDHAGFTLKGELMSYVAELGHEVVDYGSTTPERADYPVYGRRVGEAVAAGEADLGIILCGTGVGISIAASRVHGVRCACVSEATSARLSRQHNDANVLAMGSRIVGGELARDIVLAFLTHTPEGGRHAERRAMLADLGA